MLRDPQIHTHTPWSLPQALLGTEVTKVRQARDWTDLMETRGSKVGGVGPLGLRELLPGRVSFCLEAD